jgi:hypothetical protein
MSDHPGADDKETRGYRAKMVQEEVEKAIERCLAEADVTYAEAIGALELVKSTMVARYIKEHEEI